VNPDDRCHYCGYARKSHGRPCGEVPMKNGLPTRRPCLNFIEADGRPTWAHKAERLKQEVANSTEE
jgi:hypothetical protein